MTDTDSPAPVTAARPPLTPDDFAAAHENVRRHANRTPMLTSRLLSERTGFDTRLKAEVFQRTGSYKIRGPLNKLSRMTDAEKQRGVVCSSAGNHAQGVALAASIHGIHAVVVMAENATPSKIEATRAYGAEVVLHGSLWDEADEHARMLVERDGLTYVHPFDDLDMIAGQGTAGLEIVEDAGEVDAIVVPIGGGGLISGIALAAKGLRPSVKIIGVESSGAPAMWRSVREGRRVTLDKVDCAIDGLRVKQVGALTFAIVRDFVDDIVLVPDTQSFEALLWTMHHLKTVVEGAAAAPVAALLNGLIEMPPEARVVAMLSGGNIDLSRLAGLAWN